MQNLSKGTSNVASALQKFSCKALGVHCLQLLSAHNPELELQLSFIAEVHTKLLNSKMLSVDNN